MCQFPNVLHHSRNHHAVANLFKSPQATLKEAAGFSVMASLLFEQAQTVVASSNPILKASSLHQNQTFLMGLPCLPVLTKPDLCKTNAVESCGHIAQILNFFALCIALLM